jgi:hypothetical protein
MSPYLKLFVLLAINAISLFTLIHSYGGDEGYGDEGMYGGGMDSLGGMGGTTKRSLTVFLIKIFITL